MFAPEESSAGGVQTCGVDRVKFAMIGVGECRGVITLRLSGRLAPRADRTCLLMDYSTLGVHVVGIETEEIDVIVRRTSEKKKESSLPRGDGKTGRRVGLDHHLA